MKVILHFQKTGLQTLIQDSGRVGYQSYGVPISGVMDKKSAAIANELVGNPPETPLLEITLLGPKIQVEGEGQIAITGADLSPKINGQPIARYELIHIHKGDILTFAGAKNGCRTYLAVRGKWQLPQWLKSYSALPFSGDKATPESIPQKGSSLTVIASSPIDNKISLRKIKVPIFPNPLTVRVLPGPEFEEFSAYTVAYFFSRVYKLTNDSNRMGYRLDANLIDFSPKREVISSGIIPGTIQITNAGQPVILLADAQTVGGYYRIANVVTEDLDKLGQLKPGDEVRFSMIKMKEL